MAHLGDLDATHAGQLRTCKQEPRIYQRVQIHNVGALPDAVVTQRHHREGERHVQNQYQKHNQLREVSFLFPPSHKASHIRSQQAGRAASCTRSTALPSLFTLYQDNKNGRYRSGQSDIRCHSRFTSPLDNRSACLASPRACRYGCRRARGSSVASCSLA